MQRENPPLLDIDRLQHVGDDRQGRRVGDQAGIAVDDHHPRILGARHQHAQLAAGTADRLQFGEGGLLRHPAGDRRQRAARHLGQRMRASPATRPARCPTTRSAARRPGRAYRARTRRTTICRGARASIGGCARPGHQRSSGEAGLAHTAPRRASRSPRQSDPARRRSAGRVVPARAGTAPARPRDRRPAPPSGDRNRGGAPGRAPGSRRAAPGYRDESGLRNSSPRGAISTMRPAHITAIRSAM